jgi:hypothetical protein
VPHGPGHQGLIIYVPERIYQLHGTLVLNGGLRTKDSK